MGWAEQPNNNAERPNYMTTRRFNLKPGNPIAACPKCGQNTQFNAKSQQVCEDGCEVWIKCICGYAPKDGQMDSVMGGCDEDNIRMALGCWDDAIEAERAAGVARKPSEHSGARSHTGEVSDSAQTGAPKAL